MEEKRNDLFENEINEKDETIKHEECAEDEEVDVFESRYTLGDHSWYADDFENMVKNSVPKSKALSLYRPKEKKLKKLLKKPVFAAVISSFLTCVLCLGVFSLAVMPQIKRNQMYGSVLPQSSSETKTMEVSLADKIVINGDAVWFAGEIITNEVFSVWYWVLRR